MAGKHYGGQLVFAANPATTAVYPGRLNKAFSEGWLAQTAGTPNPYSSASNGADFAAYTAWQNGFQVNQAVAPPGQGAGRRWETAPSV